MYGASWSCLCAHTQHACKASGSQTGAIHKPRIPSSHRGHACPSTRVCQACSCGCRCVQPVRGVPAPAANASTRGGLGAIFTGHSQPGCGSTLPLPPPAPALRGAPRARHHLPLRSTQVRLCQPRLRRWGRGRECGSMRMPLRLLRCFLCCWREAGRGAMGKGC